MNSTQLKRISLEVVPLMEIKVEDKTRGPFLRVVSLRCHFPDRSRTDAPSCQSEQGAP
jgi:hypothetical protein